MERGNGIRTQVGAMRGAGAAKTGRFWMRLGTEGEEEEEEEGKEELLSLAKTEGRNEEGLLRERE